MGPMPSARSLWNSLDILLLDGVGALITAVNVGVVLPLFQPWFGLPTAILQALGAAATLLAVFSLSRYFLDQGTPTALRIIAVANLSYGCVTAVLLVLYAEVATWLSDLYFVGEIGVVTVLSGRELQLAARLSATPRSEA